MNGDHIASAFDRDLEQIQIDIVKMGGLVEKAISEASQSLVTGDPERAGQVRAGDAQIDQLEVQINDEAARVIALRAPTAIDLRLTLAVIKLSGVLERIADYAVNIAKRTQILVASEAELRDAKVLRNMAREVEAMLQDALDSFIRRDTELAEAVIQRDIAIDEMYNAVFRSYLTFIIEDPRSITGCMHLLFIAKNIERMGDHVTAIAEQVIYMVTGELPDEARPKADVTTTDPDLSPEPDA